MNSPADSDDPQIRARWIYILSAQANVDSRLHAAKLATQELSTAIWMLESLVDSFAKEYPQFSTEVHSE